MSAVRPLYARCVRACVRSYRIFNTLRQHSNLFAHRNLSVIDAVRTLCERHVGAVGTL